MRGALGLWEAKWGNRMSILTLRNLNNFNSMSKQTLARADNVSFLGGGGGPRDAEYVISSESIQSREDRQPSYEVK